MAITGKVSDKFCANCRHHSSYHQLITRDKWEEYGLEPGKIPWFCEHVEGEKSEICTCSEFKPIAGAT